LLRVNLPKIKSVRLPDATEEGANSSPQSIGEKRKDMKTFFTSESVCSGHPDKICDAISDAIVDAVLLQDPMGKVAIETLVTKNTVVLAGEITAHSKIDYKKIAAAEIARLGYTNPKWKFNTQANINVHIHEQSPEIAIGVEHDGAGDQGMMFGFACNQTSELMPLPIVLAHALTKKIDSCRESNAIPYLRPDGKAQVTVAYKNNTPVAVTKVVVAVPHNEDISSQQVKKDIYQKIIEPALDLYGFSISIKDVILNGTGVWHHPGPAVDTGVTGRKIVVDTYGGYAKVGGGCFSGKDPTKVDRSGAYAARFIAKNIVASRLATQAEVRLAYVIGGKKPIMQEIETFGTGRISRKKLQEFADNLIDTSVSGIINQLQLNRPIYKPTAAYGHFGRSEFPWEKIE
jgi:S-adenosylmethionine synthetase